MVPQPPLPNRNRQAPAPQRPRPRVKPPKLPAGWRGTWDKKPKLDSKKWKVGKAGPKSKFKGKWVAKPVRPAKPAAAAAPPAAAATPAAPPGINPNDPDYALLTRYADQPWAQALIRSIRADQTHHEGFVNTQVLPWASGALTGLSQINQAAQEGFSNQTAAMNAGLAAAAGATPGMVAGTSGGAVASPNQYAANASSQAMAQNASTMQQVAAYQQLMGTMQPATFSQGYIASLSDFAKGLPELYARKRGEAVDKIESFLAEVREAEAEAALEAARMEETIRHNRVTEAISATNAQTNAAIQFGRLGIDATRVAQAGEPDAGPAAAPTDVPTGYTVVPSDDGGWRVVRDPTVPAARNPSSSSSGGGGGSGGRAPSAARGEYPPNKLRKEGFVGGWKKKPKKYPNAVRATDGTWWVKPGSGRSGGSSSGGGSSSSGATRRNYGTLVNELKSLYKKDDIGGWEERYEGNPRGAGVEIAYWVRQNKPSFTMAGAGRRVNRALIERVLAQIGGRPAAEAARILAGYMTPDGQRWK